MPDSPLVGKSIEQAGLRHLPGLYLVEIERGGESRAGGRLRTRTEAGDRLVFAGIVDSIVDLQRIRGLTPATDQVFKLDSPAAQRGFIEAVVSDSCPLVGKTMRERPLPHTLQRRGASPWRATASASPARSATSSCAPGRHAADRGRGRLCTAHRNSRDFFLVQRHRRLRTPPAPASLHRVGDLHR